MAYARSNKAFRGGVAKKVFQDGKFVSVGGHEHDPLPVTERGWKRRASRNGVSIEECKVDPYRKVSQAA